MKPHEWIEKVLNQKPSEFGVRVAELLNHIFLGIHHVQGDLSRADFTNERWIRICHYTGSNGTDFATYDGDTLTRLVVAAHKMNIRVAINGAAYQYIWISFAQVDRRGFFADRHPTLDENIVKIEGGR